MPDWLTIELGVLAIVAPALAWNISFLFKLSSKTEINEVRINSLEEDNKEDGARLLRMEQKIDNLCKELHEIMGIVRHIGQK